MRFLTWALACTLGGALGVALADEPSKTPAPSSASSDAASPPATAPAAAPAAASTSAAKPDVHDEMIEKHFRAEGYKVAGAQRREVVLQADDRDRDASGERPAGVRTR